MLPLPLALSGPRIHCLQCNVYDALWAPALPSPQASHLSALHPMPPLAHLCPSEHFRST